MAFCEDLKLREAVFRKMGWDFVQDEGSVFSSGKFKWVNPGHKRIFNINELPKTEITWEVCAEYLVPFMRGRRWRYYIDTFGGQDKYVFEWQNWEEWKHEDSPAEIIDDNIARAACEAFMEVDL